MSTPIRMSHRRVGCPQKGANRRRTDFSEVKDDMGCGSSQVGCDQDPQDKDKERIDFLGRSDNNGRLLLLE